MQSLKDKGKFPADLASSGQSGMNESGTVRQSGTRLTQAGSRPVRYELIGANGEVFGPYLTAGDAHAVARGKWPHQEQDEARTGKGWDVQVVGAGQ